MEHAFQSCVVSVYSLQRVGKCRNSWLYDTTRSMTKLLDQLALFPGYKQRNWSKICSVNSRLERKQQKISRVEPGWSQRNSAGNQSRHTYEHLQHPFHHTAARFAISDAWATQILPVVMVTVTMTTGVSIVIWCGMLSCPVATSFGE